MCHTHLIQIESNILGDTTRRSALTHAHTHTSAYVWRPTHLLDSYFALAHALYNRLQQADGGGESNSNKKRNKRKSAAPQQ